MSRIPNMTETPTPAPAPVMVSSEAFKVLHQKVDLEIDFSSRTLAGKTELVIRPESKDLRTIKLNARQMRFTRLNINGKGPVMKYHDPYKHMTLHPQATANQHHLLYDKIEPYVKSQSDTELTLNVPKSIRIEEVNQTAVAESNGTLKITDTDVTGTAQQISQISADAYVTKFTLLYVYAEFVIDDIREGLHMVSHRAGDGRYPHAYTRNRLGNGWASCLFPCVDLLDSRNSWEFSVKCPRTVGAALRSDPPDIAFEHLKLTSSSPPKVTSDCEDREMIVLCSGEMTDDIVDKMDLSTKTVSFSCTSALSAQQIGFAVGPFEHVKLSELRATQEDDALGQNVIEMHGYCLPGRSEEVQNTCLPTVKAMDFIARQHCACPFRTFSMCFVDDLSSDTATSAGLALCSTRLLYPEDIIDPSEEVTRKLTHTIASQWVGIDIIPQEPTDMWIIVGVAHFITETFMKELCGNNEYRFRMRQQADRVCELDRERPSLYDLGALLHVDPSELEIMALKAPLVLFILDRRIAKVVGISKMVAIITKILSRARRSELPDNALSTDIFQRTCERFYHAKIDDFLNQWVRGAGCPRFHAVQRFNKKKLVVEMMIKQIQSPHGEQQVEPRNLEVETFMRDVREDFQEVFAAPVQSVFTGPMTIRIHEADGTPYEHIVEIKEGVTKFDIPYNTKYKRLKRSKRQRERVAAVGTDATETENEALLYCLGDVLQTEEEVREWKLSDWSAEDEERMNAESYEWVRLDTDFEWICRMQLQMPGYMFVSQLQQDRDVVAQLESVQHINNYPPNPLISTILLRTLMDRRYFHGIRSQAARALTKQADQEMQYIGFHHLKKAFEEMFCLPELNSRMTRPNDFSNRAAYYVQCAILEAISKVRDRRGFAPSRVKEFLLDKLKFNDNSVNKASRQVTRIDSTRVLIVLVL